MRKYPYTVAFIGILTLLVGGVTVAHATDEESPSASVAVETISNPTVDPYVVEALPAQEEPPPAEPVVVELPSPYVPEPEPVAAPVTPETFALPQLPPSPPVETTTTVPGQVFTDPDYGMCGDLPCCPPVVYNPPAAPVWVDGQPPSYDCNGSNHVELPTDLAPAQLDDGTGQHDRTE